MQVANLVSHDPAGVIRKPTGVSQFASEVMREPAVAMCFVMRRAGAGSVMSHIGMQREWIPDLAIQERSVVLREPIAALREHKLMPWKRSGASQGCMRVLRCPDFVIQCAKSLH